MFKTFNERAKRYIIGTSIAGVAAVISVLGAYISHQENETGLLVFTVMTGALSSLTFAVNLPKTVRILNEPELD